VLGITKASLEHKIQNLAGVVTWVYGIRT